MRLRRFFSVGDLTLLIVNSMPRYGLQLLKIAITLIAGKLQAQMLGLRRSATEKLENRLPVPTKSPAISN